MNKHVEPSVEAVEAPILDVHRFVLREGDLLEHQAGGSIWRVLKIIGGPHGDLRAECVVEGDGAKLGRVDTFHGEYTVRSFALVPRAALPAIYADLLPHDRAVGHLESIATLLEGMRTGAGGIPIDTTRDVQFLRQLAVSIATAMKGGGDDQ